MRTRVALLLLMPMFLLGKELGTQDVTKRGRFAKADIGLLQDPIQEPARALYWMQEQYPKVHYFLVTAVHQIDTVTFQLRFYYDRQNHTLLRLERSDIYGNDRDLAWQLWPKVAAAQFKTGLPYSKNPPLPLYSFQAKGETRTSFREHYTPPFKVSWP